MEIAYNYIWEYTYISIHCLALLYV